MKTKADHKLAARIVKLLNELLASDPAAINMLFRHRVQCNKKISDHPTVQVLSTPVCATVGILGILNGLCGTNKKGWGLVAMDYGNMALEESSAAIEKFEVLEVEAKK